MSAYQFTDHTFDVVVVGAGGSGLRARCTCRWTCWRVAPEAVRAGR